MALDDAGVRWAAALLAQRTLRGASLWCSGPPSAAFAQRHDSRDYDRKTELCRCTLGIFDLDPSATE